MTDPDLERACWEALIGTSLTANNYDDGQTFTTEAWRECSVNKDD